MYVNTLLVQQILADPKWADTLAEADRRALSPLFWTHVNTYGRFELDMNRHLDLHLPTLAAGVPRPRTAEAEKGIRVIGTSGFLRLAAACFEGAEVCASSPGGVCSSSVRQPWTYRFSMLSFIEPSKNDISRRVTGMGMTRSQEDPLRPLTMTVAAASVVTAGWICFEVLNAVSGGVSDFGFGTGACLEVPESLPAYYQSTAGTSSLMPHSYLWPATYDLCATEPSVHLRLTVALTRLPSAVLFLGVLVFMHRFLRGAKSEGVYGRPAARRLRFLGWYLIIGGLAVETTQLLALGVAVDLQQVQGSWWNAKSYWETPVTLLLVGVGLLTFARIMRIGTRMSEDLEGTV